ncbi:cell division protein ZapE [Marinicauda salina]|uniref:Cell division protein ZapE n=1 Tax=Marinicauda salina TaxID=2135793 RepID=A0A2U2BW70_9PROT|nr:cell division protein ZapE [Marinicauda salina]PWE18240.1 cell division protein ZapE [Marinicauda salina]
MTPSEALSRAVAEGRLRPDPVQAEAAERLTVLCREIADWKGGEGGLFRRSRPAPKGLYLWGGVGTGKSLMMDLFFKAAPIRKKRRVHFHQFMLEMHERIAAQRETRDRDPLPVVAGDVAKQTRLLCFDELHVTDVADAMILGRLFEHLFEAGVVVVATSNRHPDDLYRNGLNRQLFEPFIELIKDRLAVMELDCGRDYRLENLESAPVYYAPLGAETEQAMDAAFARLTLGAQPRACTLAVQGREVEVPREAAGVARFAFEELCARPLGAADYLAIAKEFHTVMIDGVPVMGPAKRNEAARFVTLIDALYEVKTKLVMSADAEPDDLYREGDGAFEFQRTASRLMEMRTHDYLAAERRTESEEDDETA